MCYRFHEDRDNPRVCAIWADALARAGKFSAAEQVLQKGLAKNPNSGFLNAGLARLRIGQAKVVNEKEKKLKAKQAHEVAEATLEKHESFVDALVAKGNAELEQGFSNQALRAGEALVKWNPKYSPGLEIMSRAYLGLSRPDALSLAEKYARAATLADPCVLSASSLAARR